MERREWPAAYRRGYERGEADRAAGAVTDAPLSGEWAGESIPELLGDLIDDEGCDMEQACDEYEAGYFDAVQVEA